MWGNYYSSALIGHLSIFTFWVTSASPPIIQFQPKGEKNATKRAPNWSGPKVKVLIKSRANPKKKYATECERDGCIEGATVAVVRRKKKERKVRYRDTKKNYE